MKQIVHKIQDGRFIFFCQGCGCGHQFWTGETGWQFNGDLEKPTITPSLLILYGNHGDKGRCHSFVTDGKIKFLDDCTHELKGKEIELDDLNNNKFYDSPIFHRVPEL